ncbi:MAG: inorganic phosphate transporter [Sandaracinaceae bacterium]
MEVLFDGSMPGGTLALLLGCLVVALGFEFVNGFHDTANAVATVIYTKTLKPVVAVVFSGVLNFTGVYVGGIAVAIAITRLLPVELLVSGGIGRGLAMVIAMLLAAVIWNLGTWWKGIPASSSHTLIGAILGVGIANSALNGHVGEGVNWDKALGVGLSLLVSPLVGFGLAAALLWLMHRLVRDERIFKEPVGDLPPPWWIRGLLVLTCGGVSFSHGSNDGQKGVGLIMLILIGFVPAGFALDLDAPSTQLTAARTSAESMIEHLEQSGLSEGCAEGSTEPACVIAAEARIIASTLAEHESVRDIPRDQRWQVREGVLRIDDALTHLGRAGASASVVDELRTDRTRIAPLTDYAPSWVIFAVALALGVGTMIGWKRIVVTVGEKIGKSKMTYAQGFAAQLVAMVTIGLSSWFGLPVSTTHVLSSGVAGTMMAEKSGLDSRTIRNIALAWVLTLPAAMSLSAVLFVGLAELFR